MNPTDQEPMGAVEILAELNAEPEGYDDDETPAPDPDPTEEAAEETPEEEEAPEREPEPPGKIVLNGEEYDHESLLALIEAGKNPSKALAEATRRNQEAAEARRSYEPYLEDVRQLHELPDAQRERVLAAVKNALTEAVETPDVPHVSEEDMTGTERALNAQIRRLERQLAQIGQKVATVDGFVQETKSEREARLAAEEINARYSGANATPEGLMALAREAGTTNYRAAWVLANEERIAKGAYRAGLEAATPKPKPKAAPESETKTFSREDASLDDAINLRMRGFTPR